MNLAPPPYNGSTDEINVWLNNLYEFLKYPVFRAINIHPPYSEKHRSKFRWKDGDEIYIGPGRYFHDGTIPQIVYWDSDITFKLQSAGSNGDSDDYGADAWHYIYLDDSAIITNGSNELDASCFLNDTTAPTWSDTKHGWYNGSDLCIFANYETGGVILGFNHDGGELVITDTDLLCGTTAKNAFDYQNIDLDATWDDCYIPVPSFCQKALCTFRSSYGDVTVGLYWRINGSSGSGHFILQSEAGTTRSINTFSVSCDASQIIEVYHSVDGTNLASVWANGWYFPVGM